MIPTSTTLDPPPGVHPLTRLAEQGAPSFPAALALAVAGVEVELNAARRAGDAAAERALWHEYRRLARARRLYLDEQRRARAAVAARLRAAGSADLASALETGDYRRLGW
jgi:hypothetical protein